VRVRVPDARPFRPPLVLAPTEDAVARECATGAQLLYASLFRGRGLVYWRKLRDALLWRLHGGSGYSLTQEDLLKMPWDDLEWFAHRAHERREEESRALRAAAQAKPSIPDGEG
jgi:hypothetical protein